MIDEFRPELIMAWLDNELPPAKVAELQERMLRDDLFFERAVRVIDAWHTRRERERPIPKEELESSWRRFAKMAGIPLTPGEGEHTHAKPSRADEIDTKYSRMSDEELDNSDLGLITDYVTRQASPEQIAEVERRILVDEEFRELSVPILVAWAVPTKRERATLSEASLAEVWEIRRKEVGKLLRGERP